MMMDGKQGDQSDAKKTEGDQHPSPSSDYAPYPTIDPKDVAPPTQRENWGTFVKGSQSPPEQSSNKSPSEVHKSVSWSSDLTSEEHPPIPGNQVTSMPPESNPYVSSSPTPSSSFSVKNTVDSVRDTLGRFGKKVEEATRKAEDLAGNVWQHL